MFCSRCGYENRAEARYCARCGNSLFPSEATQSTGVGTGEIPQSISNVNTANQTKFIGEKPKRHWTVTVAFVIWILATLSNLYTTAFGFFIRYNPEIGVGLILTLLSLFTAVNMYDADREGLYTGIIAIVIALVWDFYLVNVVSIVVVIIIAGFTFAASSHLLKGGIKKAGTR